MPISSPLLLLLGAALLLTLLCSVPTPADALFTKEWFQEARARSALGSNGGGIDCVGCTIAADLMMQLAVVNDQPIEQVIDNLCNKYLPAEMAETCDYFVNEYGKDFIQLVESGCNSDEACAALSVCTNYPTCHLRDVQANHKCELAKMKVLARNGGVPGKRPISARTKEIMTRVVAQYKLDKFDPWAWLQAIFGAVGNHLPEVDLDHDKFSSTPELRGSNWRGKDCSPLDSTIYPGRIGNPALHNRVDDNCNGISGKDPVTGKAYEDLFCTGTGATGIAVVGDSAGAHFQIPEEYMNASQITETTYSNLFDLLLDEMDWPEIGGYTGYLPQTAKLEYVDSLYKRMFEQNHCNHRDYQNCAVNGARSGATNTTIINTLARNAMTDKPLLMFLELIGNDVCNGHPTFDTMTTVADFKANILSILNYLDAGVLPAGSHVVFIGLADGLALWDNLHNRTHPIGVTYEAVYNYLNCFEISPCWVWMNSNRTVRETGQARADQLSAVYSEIISDYKFKNFDMAYYDFPLKAIAAQWIKDGGQGVWQLIEPTDGFHPNQIANSLMADYLWKQISINQPHFLGGVNPNNANITKIFGDQGGY